MHASVVTFAVVVAALTHALSATAQDQWLGQHVFTKPGIVAKVGNTEVDASLINFPARVTDVKGDWLWLGSAWVRKSDVMTTEQALTYFTDKIRAEPNAGKWYNARSAIWRHKGDLDNALTDVSEAIRLDPTRSTYLTRGAIWQLKGDFDKAIEDYTECIRLNPDIPQPFYNRGNVWKSKGKTDHAIEDYTEAIRLAPTVAMPYKARGDAWYIKGDVDQAIEDYTEAIRLDFQDIRSHNGLAWLLATCPEEKYRDGARAVALATKACESCSFEDWTYVDTLAAAYAESGEFDLAVEWQTKAIELMPGEATEADRVELRGRLELYQAGKPFHEAPQASATM